MRDYATDPSPRILGERAMRGDDTPLTAAEDAAAAAEVAELERELRDG